jgi:hypothetical protein
MSSKKRPPSDLHTSAYNHPNWFYKAFKQLVQATHWVDPDTSEEVKLSHNLKAVYHHRLEQYTSFSSKGQLYLESNRTVSDKLGIDYDMIRRDYNKQLKRMGLLDIDNSVKRRPVYTVFELKHLKGYLINKNLQKHTNNLSSHSKSDKKESVTYEQLKRIDKNKRNIDKIKDNLKEDLIVMTREELDKLLNR